MKSLLAAAVLILATFAVAACEQRAPAPPRPVTQSVTTQANLVGDPAAGARLWRDKQCQACHGAGAAGGIGKPLAATPLAFPAFLDKIRNALPPKPAMNENDLPEAEAYSIYLWLQSLRGTAAATAAPAALPPGQVLGITLWTQKGCADCHGTFAQGSDKGPTLVGQAYPFERQRAVMRRYAEQNPAHGERNIDDETLLQLLDWLRRGADPASGC